MYTIVININKTMIFGEIYTRMPCTLMWKQDLYYKYYIYFLYFLYLYYKSLPTCHTCTMPCGPGSETWVGHTLRMFHFSNENISYGLLPLIFFNFSSYRALVIHPNSIKGNKCCRPEFSEK